MTTLLSDQSKMSFIVAIGDPRLRPQCIWVSGAGQVCPKDVSMDSRNLASSEIFAMECNLSRPTRKNISRIARFLLCEDCRVYETRYPEIVRRLDEKSQSLCPLFHYGNQLFYLGRNRLPVNRGIPHPNAEYRSSAPPSRPTSRSRGLQTSGRR